VPRQTTTTVQAFRHASNARHALAFHAQDSNLTVARGDSHETRVAGASARPAMAWQEVMA
jgi:hypothetical protein